jgi:hypothetical protein
VPLQGKAGEPFTIRAIDLRVFAFGIGVGIGQHDGGTAEVRRAEPVATTPQQFDAFMAAERAKYQQVVKASGAKVD